MRVHGSMKNAIVGVAGLGSMGSGMAMSLLRAGFAVRGVDVDPARAERLAATSDLSPAATPADAARDADALLISVVNAAQTQTVLFGAGGAVEALPPGSVVIATSTVPPLFVETLEGNCANAASSSSTHRSRAARPKRQRVNFRSWRRATRRRSKKRPARSTRSLRKSTGWAIAPASVRA